MTRSYHFTHAILRKPGASIANGLRAEDQGNPSHKRFLEDHEAYAAALVDAGAEITVLEPAEDLPDSVFVEDAALCLQEGAIIMRPGAPSRLAEADLMAPHLEKHYGTVERIQGPGFIEGGDILVTEREILVGRSARTDAAGVEELRSIVSKWGYALREVHTPPGVLHFKTDCSLLDDETILATERLDASACFEGYRVIHTALGEEAAANAIRFNGVVLLPAGFPKTAQKLEGAGYSIRQIGNTEAAKVDGGMSCLSLRFTPLPKP